MPVDKDLLNKILFGKEAYAPPSPNPGMPGMDPSAMAGDPAMMAAGGMAPPGAGMAPAGGGAPMDPGMMAAGGMAPPGAGMAPAGGAAPMDPSMVQGLPDGGGPAAGTGGMPGMEGMPIMLNADDLMALFQQIGGQAHGAPGEESTGRVTNRKLSDQVDELTTMVGQLMSHFNLTPAGEIPGMSPETPAEAPAEEGTTPGMGGDIPPVPPGVMAAIGEAPAEEPAMGGMPAPEMTDMGVSPMDMGMPKAAGESNRDQLRDILRQMNTYK